MSQPDGELRRDLRVSDSDRDAAVETLKERAADGTLTLDEFADRVGRALVARTYGDLDAVTTDLRATRAPDKRARSPRHNVIAVMAGADTKGRWRCGSKVTAVAVMGGCHLDFRQAEIVDEEVHVVAVAVMGGIDIVVPEGIAVAMDGMPIMGGRTMRVKDVPILPGSPRIVVHAYPIMGGVVVRSMRGPRDHAAVEAGGPAEISPEPTPVVEPRQPEPPATSWLDGTVTIMFSDVCDYTGITHRLGDERAHTLLREHNELVRAQITAFGGREVKSNGDGFMVAFSSTSRALRCATALQRRLAERNATTTGEPIRLHIGIHTGDVVVDGNDLVGGAVIVASRLADVAGPEEILVSSVARDLAGGSREFVFEEPRLVALKGVDEARPVFPVRWQDAPLRAGS
jgi:class 3 adenylate cyclase